MTWAEIIEDKAVNNQSLWFTVLTEEEYNTMCKGHGQVTKLEGAIRSHRGWHQLILHPASQDAVSDMAYHLSMSHVPISDSYVLIALTVDGYNWCSHNSTKKNNYFRV